MMRKSTRRELRKLRELVHVLARGKVCCFCGLPLLSNARDGFQGNADGPRLVDRITVHHGNGDHSDNAPENHELAHRRCHKQHHGRQRRRTPVQVDFGVVSWAD